MGIEQLELELNRDYDYVLCPIDKAKGIYTIRDEKRIHLATIKCKNFCVSFNTIAQPTTVELINTIRKYNDTLPFSPRYYDPLCNINTRTECALHDYLIKIGFEYVNDCNNSYFKLGDIYGRGILKLVLSMDSNRESSSGLITDVTNNNSKYIIHSKFTDVENGVTVINAIIESKMLVDITKEINVLDKISDKRDYNKMKAFDTTTLENVDLKALIKERLQKALDLLNN